MQAVFAHVAVVEKLMVVAEPIEVVHVDVAASPAVAELVADCLRQFHISGHLGCVDKPKIPLSYSDLFHDWFEVLAGEIG